jgi:hypothetical protein
MVVSGRCAVVSMAAVSLVAALSLGACSGSGTELASGSLDAPDNKHLSATERSLRDSVRKDRQIEAGVTGCLIGGVAGYLGTVLTGGSKQTAVKAAAVLCVGGAVVGVAWGSYVDARAQEYANQQELVTKLTAAAREDVARYQRVNANLRKLIEEERARIGKAGAKAERTKADIAASLDAVEERKTTVRQLEAKLAEIDDNIKTIEADQAELSKKGVETAVLNAPKRELRAERTKLSTNIGALKQLSAARS